MLDDRTDGDDVTGDLQSESSLEPVLPERSDRSQRIGLAVIAGLVVVGIGLIALSPRSVAPAAPPPVAALAESADAGPTSVSAPAVAVPSAAPEPVRPPPAWRVASLKTDPGIEVTEGTFGKRGLVQSLTQAGLARAEIKRLAHAFDGVRHFDHPATTDAFVLAKDRAKGTVVAFEVAASPVDVWQVHFDDTGASAAKKLDVFVEHRRVASGLVVNGDLAKAISAAGQRPEIVNAVDDALEGHLESGSMRAGVRLRIASTEDWVDGQFVRVKVDAVEFVPGPSAKAPAPLRVYFYERDSAIGSHRRAPAAGFYDAKGKQPYHGAFRSPLALARMTSRFNPKRMHPVLKVVMPHNGVDFAGAPGTPVYASGSGTVTTAGNGGPCGNMVEIQHGNGLDTVYCHLKGFAPGLHAGQKVEARDLLGYVGQTGRVTGPHLHFGV